MEKIRCSLLALRGFFVVKEVNCAVALLLRWKGGDVSLVKSCLEGSFLQVLKLR